MLAAGWPVALAFAVGAAVGAAIPLLVISAGWGRLLCKRGWLCSRAKLHQEPQQIHLSWRGAPEGSLTVTWVTGSADNPNVVQYRPTGSDAWRESAGGSTAVPRSGLAPAAGVLHRVEIEGLDADTAYEYRVSSDVGASRAWSGIRTTRTAPRDGPFTFAFVADTGQAGRIDGLSDGVAEVLRAVQAEDPLFVLGGGDYAYADRDGRFTDPNLALDGWFRMMEPLISEKPFMAQYGNHEIRLVERLRLWKPRFAHPPGFDGGDSYSFDVAGTHFTGLLADGHNHLGPKLIEWLDRDLAAARARGCDWLIVFQHEPIYGTGSSHPARSAAPAVLAPVFLRHGVDLHLSAHDQNFERTFPLVGDPAKPRVASAETEAYRKGAGVIYAKVSPSGKMSEIGRGFSRLPDAKPDHVAARDDTAHHFAVVSVARESLEVRVLAVGTDGRPARTIDRFRIEAEARS